jgi:hypothetical protein
MATDDSCFFEMDDSANLTEEMAALVDSMIEAPVAITPPASSPTLHRANARKEISIADMFREEEGVSIPKLPKHNSK